MPIYTLTLSSRTFCNILENKQEEKSYDMKKFTPNCGKCNCDVISTNFDPVKLRNVEICPEYSRKNTSVDNYDFIMQPYETIPPIKLRKTSHRSRTGVGKLFTRRARFAKTVEAAGRTLIGKQGEDLFFLRSRSTYKCDLQNKRFSPRFSRFLLQFCTVEAYFFESHCQP